MKIVTAIICGIFFCCFCSCDKADPVSYNIDDGLYATLKNDFKDWESKNDDEKIAKLSEAYYLGDIPVNLSLLGFITGNTKYIHYVDEIATIYREKFIVEGMLRPTSLGGGKLV